MISESYKKRINLRTKVGVEKSRIANLREFFLFLYYSRGDKREREGGG